MTKSPPRPLLTTTPPPGSMTDIGQGISWLRTPLPFALDHVNLWLIDDPAGGSAAVDAGLGHPVTRDLWQSVMHDKKITQIFITHCHPDHIGLAGWLWAANNQPPIYLTAGEETMARHLCDEATLARWLPIHLAAYHQAGLGEAETRAMLDRMSKYKQAVTPLPDTFITIKNGDVITLGGRDWAIIEGFGHSPEHASLYCARDDIFIAGDMVLPYISPNISLTPRNPPGDDPLARYIESLTRIKSIVPDTALVLPMHGVPFYGLHNRIDTLVKHHGERCDEVADILRRQPAGLSAASVMRLLFSKRNLDPNTLFFALGEAMAHLRYMHKLGRIVASEDDIVLYRLTA